MSWRVPLRLAVFLLLVPALSISGQEPPQEPAGAVTTSQVDLPTDFLALQLEPLTRAELEVEAEAWLVLVKDQAQTIAQTEIAARQAETSAAAAELRKKVEALEKKRDARLERFSRVLDALEQKGGDVETYRQYAAAVSGIKANLRDASTAWQTFKSWITNPDGGLKWAIQAIKFVAILISFWILARVIGSFIRKLLDRGDQVSPLLRTFINKTSRRLILFVGLLIALGTIGVNVGAAVALIGGGAFIFAFALQDTLANLANGMMLLFNRPFDVGDAVEVGGITGKVDSVSLVNTTILTFDNKKVIVPNKKVWGEVITNITGMPIRRVDMTFGIGYDDDIEHAESIIRKVLAGNELILDDPEPLIKFRELADSSMNFMVCPWAKTSDYLTVISEVNKGIKREFDAAGISIPYPQRDVHLHQVEAAAASDS